MDAQLDWQIPTYDSLKLVEFYQNEQVFYIHYAKLLFYIVQ